MNNQRFHALNSELSDSDPLCRYVTVERSYIEFVLAQSAERTSQLAIACELLQRTRTELLRAWGTDENKLQAYQQAALRSIDESLAGSRATVRMYRHSVRREFAAVLRNLLTRTQSALKEDAKREREHKRKQIAQTIEDMGEGLTIVLECLDSLLAQLLAREEISAADKARSAEAPQPLILFVSSKQQLFREHPCQFSLRFTTIWFTTQLSSESAFSLRILRCTVPRIRCPHDRATASPTLPSTGPGHHGCGPALADCARCSRSCGVRSRQDPDCAWA